MSAREQPLTVAIDGDRLTISIGIDALIVAAQGADDWPEEDIRIVDADAFAAAIARYLEDEEEDGTTGIHLAIDAAVMSAIEDPDAGLEDITSRSIFERDQ